MLSKLCRRTGKSAAKHARRSRERVPAERRRFRPDFEVLESRVLLSASYQFTGLTTVAENSAYTLNLVANQPPTQWTISWGDGGQDTVLGSSTSANHTYYEDGTFDISVTALSGLTNQKATDVQTGNTQLPISVNAVPPRSNPTQVPTLNLSGPAVLDASHTLPLTLSATGPGSNTVSQWTVYWGDTTSQTIAVSSGAPVTVSHTYLAPGNYSVTATATDAYGSFATSDVLVDDLNTGNVLRYSGATGTFQKVFAAPTPNPTSMVYGPDGNLYLADLYHNDVVRYDVTTGQASKFVQSGSLGPTAPYSAAFGPDGNLYVGSYATHQILEFNGQTGLPVGVFVNQGTGGLFTPTVLAFGPDGNLYVSDAHANGVLVFNGATGQFITNLAANFQGGSQPVYVPTGIAFGPDGDLYIGLRDTGVVLRYDPVTHQSLGTFVNVGPSILTGAAGMRFGPDGNLYVVDFRAPNAGAIIPGTQRVVRFNGQTGALEDIFVTPGSGGGLQRPADVNFIGNPFQVSVPDIGTFPPAVDAGPALYTLEQQPVTLRGTVQSYNVSDPPVYSYSWQVTNSTGVVAATSSNLSFVFTPPLAGTYTARLTATDQNGYTSQSSTTITAYAVAPKLTIAGTGPVTPGAPYTIALSAQPLANDPIQSWTVQWGDGATSTLPGNATSATHTYTQAQPFYQVTASASDADGTFTAMPLTPDIVQSWGRFERYGDPVYQFSLQKLANPYGLFEQGGPVFSSESSPVVGPDGSLYLVGDGGVAHFDSRTGQFLGFLIPPTAGLGNQSLLAFGPDGNLYVISSRTGLDILRYDGKTGQFLGYFYKNTTQFIYVAQSMAFGPDGNLYVVNYNYAYFQVLCFKGGTGQYLGPITGPIYGGISLAFAPDGTLYFAGGNQIDKYDIATQTVSTFITVPPPPPSAPAGVGYSFYSVTFAPDGSLYVPGDYGGAVSLAGEVFHYDAGGTLQGMTQGGPFVGQSIALLLVLTLQVAATPLQSSDPSYPPPVLPLTVSGAIAAPGSSAFYFIPGHVGQGGGTQYLDSVAYVVQSTGGTPFTPKLSLYNQIGQLVATSAGTAPGSTEAELVYAVNGNETGPAVYLEVSAADGLSVGSYSVSIENLASPVGNAVSGNQAHINLVPGGPAATVTLNADGSVSISPAVGPSTTLTVSWPAGEGPPQWIMTGHFLSPDRVDVALASPTRIWVLQNTGTGTLGTSLPSISLTAAPFDLVPQTQILSGDFNGDGLDDFVLLANGQITTLLSDGNNQFHEAAKPVDLGYLPPTSLQTVGVTPAAGTPLEFPLPDLNQPSGKTVAPDGSFWISDVGGLARISPAGVISQFSIPNPNPYSPGAQVLQPSAPVLDKNGNLWFAWGHYIEEMSPAGTILKSFYANIQDIPPGENGFFMNVVVGPDGNIWFTDAYEANDIGRLDVTTGQVTAFPLPAGFGAAADIIVGPDQNLWFTANGWYPSPPFSAIGRITTSGNITIFQTPGRNRGLTVGPDGNLWATEGDLNQIIRMTLSGSVTAFAVPTPHAGLSDMVAGPDGALWFTEDGANQIARITVDGQISEIPTPVGDEPADIAAGANNIWFSEYWAGKVGEIFPKLADAQQALTGERLSLVDNYGRVFVGLGDGTFQAPLKFSNSISELPIIQYPLAYSTLPGAPTAVTGDFNRDGNVDEALVTNLGQVSDSVEILLGQGNGTFDAPLYYTVGPDVSELIAGYFKGDGRLDLATANMGSASTDGSISVLLGYGNGQFQDAVIYDLGSNFHPTALVAGDFLGNGITDLIASDPNSGRFAFLQGNGDGTFQPVQWLAGVQGIRCLVAGDFDGDHHPDLAAATSSGVDIFYGQGNGTFVEATPAQTGLPSGNVSGLQTADFNGDGIADLAMFELTSGGTLFLVVSLGQTNRTFVSNGIARVRDSYSMTVADLNGDGVPDLYLDGVSYLNSGDGVNFTPVSTGDVIAAQFNAVEGTHAPGQGVNTSTLIGGDFNNSGRAGISNYGALTVATSYDNLLAAPSLPSNFASAPIVQTFGSATDAFILEGSGKILMRQQTAQPGIYGPPQVLNPQTLADGTTLVHPASALVLFSSGGTWYLAATDQRTDTVDLYQRQLDGSWQLLPGTLLTGSLPDAIVAGNLNGQPGEIDLIVRNSGDGTLSIFWGNGSGGFNPSPTIVQVPTDFGGLQLLGGSGGRQDIVLTDYSTGDLLVLQNQGHGAFVEAGRYQAGTYDWVHNISSYFLDYAPNYQAQSIVGTTQVVAGNIDGSGNIDLLALNSGLNTFSILAGEGHDSFTNPQTIALDGEPTAAVLGSFAGSGQDDVAVCVSEAGQYKLEVFLNGPNGLSTAPSFTYALPFLPAGITTVQDPDGHLDLLVSGGNGDVVTLLGNGDGSFRPVVPAGASVPFVTTDANGDVVLANQLGDQVVAMQHQAGATTISSSSATFSQNASNGLLAPSDVLMTTVNGTQYLIVANSGENQVLVYQGKGGSFTSAPQAYDVGTDPVGLAVADLNGDGTPDLVVANKGSNDVSVLLGSIGANGGWTLTSTERLSAGSGPVGVTVQYQNGIPNLFVSNSGGTITELPGIGSNGVGSGFFNDTTNPPPLNLGSSVIQGLTGGFVLTSAGIFQVNLNNLTAAEVFASTALTAFTTSGNEIVAGFDDGSVSVLSEQNGHLAESLTFQNAELTDPSALQVVNSQGQQDVYATTAGQSLVFVFAVPNFQSAIEPRTTISQVQSVSEAGLALVASLVTGSSEAALEESGASSFMVGLGTTNTDATALALLATLLTGTSGSAGEDPAPGNPPKPGAATGTLKSFISGTDQQRLSTSAADADDEAATPLPDMRGLAAQVFDRWSQATVSAAEVIQLPVHHGALPVFDALTRLGSSSGGTEGTSSSWQALLEAVRSAAQQAGSCILRSLDSAFSPPRTGLLPVSGPGANGGLAPAPAVGAVSLAELSGDSENLLSAALPGCEPDDWQSQVATALVISGLWQVREGAAGDERARAARRLAAPSL
jgi:streptogramin lyase